MAHRQAAEPVDNAPQVLILEQRPLLRPSPFYGEPMNLNLSIGPLIALIAGILILIMPRMLNYIVAIYLIIIGLVGLLGGSFNLR
jgi:hypothetical protein